MPTPDWQESSFSGEGNNCLGVAAAPGDTLWLRESDAPETILPTTPAGLRALLRAAGGGQFDGNGGRPAPE